MPVEVGKAEDFAPIFGFLYHESYEDTNHKGYKPNFEFLKGTNSLPAVSLYLNFLEESSTKMVA